jgi:hypothetical protein
MATILLCGVDLLIRSKLEALVPEHRFETSDVVERFPDIPILGFTNHTDTAGLQRAHAAGFDQVIAKSALFDRGPEVIGRLLASVE